MDIITSAGSKIYISDTSEPANVAAYEALTWQEVGEIEDLGEFGDSAEIIRFIALNNARVRKSKGARDAGDLNLVVGYDPADQGQQDLDTAEGTNSAYCFKVTRDDQITPTTGNPTTDYFRAIVASRRKNYGNNSNIQRVTYSLAITSEILTDPAT